MANRAQLSPPKDERTSWPWHQVNRGSVSASLLMSKARRMEAESFLGRGYGLRQSIESKAGWVQLGTLAHIWKPGRLKAIQVSPEFGSPFLAAMQVFDARPSPRKWLSLDRTEDATQRFVNPGQILVTRSGSVGRSTLSYGPHDGVTISDDLLRVDPYKRSLHGWVYAYLDQVPRGTSCRERGTATSSSTWSHHTLKGSR